ncbi:MAG: SDR family oxidoreductase [Candidatus Bipolaricaulia bacterium]
MAQTYLVTGGAGFIGSHLVERLIEVGERVRVFDNLSTGRLENIESLSGVELVEADLMHFDRLREAMAGVDLVFHQAALPSVPRSVKDPQASHAANATGTLNLLIAARDAGVRRVVYASSSSVYGETPELPKREAMRPDPRSPYAVSKLAGELYCKIFHSVYGLETISLRYFNVFGPRQDPASPYAAVIPKFIDALLAGRPPTIYGDGDQSRDFTYIDNVVAANLLAAQAERGVSETFNIACGQRTTVNELARSLSEIIGASVAPRHESPRSGDVRHSLADISRAEELLDYRPTVGLREGLERTVAWHQQGEPGGSR